METTSAFMGLACRSCERQFGVDTHGRCPDCGGRLDPKYVYESIDPDRVLPERSPADIWTFDALLPFPRREAESGAEGGTPLVNAPRLAAELDVEEVYLKDEGRNPTGTGLDRGMSVAATALAGHEDGADVEPIALPAAGNGGQSAAAYLGRLGLRSYAFVPSRTAFSNKAMINVHGGEMRVIGGRYPDAEAAVDDQLEADYYDFQEFETPYRHEGAKTIAFELYLELGSVPEYVFVPASTGEFVVGVEKGFRELSAIGATDEMPTIVAVQPEGCAPIVGAIERGLESPEPWSRPDTICGELEIPDPNGGDLAIEAVESTDGDAIAVPDEEILASAVAIAQNEVIEAGPGGGAAAAGAWSYAEDDGFDGSETIVLLNTEAGVKTPDILRSHLMSQGI